METEIINESNLPEAWIRAEIAEAEQINHRFCSKAEFTLEPDGERVHERFWWYPVKFERIRRITGYLVGDMTRWNDAKTAEEHDRVKHGMK